MQIRMPGDLWAPAGQGTAPRYGLHNQLRRRNPFRPILRGVRSLDFQTPHWHSLPAGPTPDRRAARHPADVGRSRERASPSSRSARRNGRPENRFAFSRRVAGPTAWPRRHSVAPAGDCIGCSGRTGRHPRRSDRLGRSRPTGRPSRPIRHRGSPPVVGPTPIAADPGSGSGGSSPLRAPVRERPSGCLLAPRLRHDQAGGATGPGGPGSCRGRSGGIARRPRGAVYHRSRRSRNLFPD